MKNKYCELTDLRNESDVEQFFVINLIKDLGFKNEDVYTKKVLPAIEFGKGSKKQSYIPDYQLNDGKTPLMIIEAKSPDVKLENFVYEAQEYAGYINRSFIGSNPIKYCITTNGVTTILIKPDENIPVLKLKFSDFEQKNEKKLLQNC